MFIFQKYRHVGEIILLLPFLTKIKEFHWLILTKIVIFLFLELIPSLERNG